MNYCFATKTIKDTKRGERMEHIAELGGIVTGFNVTEHCIDCMCGKNLFKIDKCSGIIIW